MKNTFKQHQLRNWVATGVSPSGVIVHVSVAARTPIEAQSELLRRYPFYTPKGAVLESESLLQASGRLGSIKVPEEAYPPSNGLKTPKAGLPDSEIAPFGLVGWVTLALVLYIGIEAVLTWKGVVP